ncbi:hypothetical protein Tco_0548868 [Tanacetum coccineum]
MELSTLRDLPCSSCLLKINFYDMALPPRKRRHAWLRQVHWVQTLDFDELTEDIDQDVTKRLRMHHTDAKGQVLFTSYAWRELLDIYGPLVREIILEFFSTPRFIVGVLDLDSVDTFQFQLGGLRRQLSWRQFISVLRLRTMEEMEIARISLSGNFLGLAPSYTLIMEPLRRLCHRLIAFTISGKGQAPEKVTTTDLLYPRSMDEETVVNVPYLLTQCLFRHALGRKQGAQMLGGHFIARLAACGATEVDLEAPQEDMPAGQEGVQADPILEEVLWLGESLGEQCMLLDRMSSDHARFSTWMVGRMTQLIEQSDMSNMSASNQQTLTDLGANDRPPMLEKCNYIPWESRFRTFMNNKLKDRERMWRSIKKGAYVRPIITDPDDTTKQIIEPLSKMTEINKKQYTADVRVMNYPFQAIPNDIYNSVDACKNRVIEVESYRIRELSKQRVIEVERYRSRELSKQRVTEVESYQIASYQSTMFLNVDKLEKQLDKEEFEDIGSMASFNALETQFQMFIKSRIYLDDEYVVMTRNYSLQYTQLAILDFRDTLIQHMESEKVDSSKALDASLADTESSGTTLKEQDTSSRSGNDADIRPIYDEEPIAEVQTSAEINVFATGQQHTKQPKSNNEAEVDQNAEQCHDKCPLHAKLTDNHITEHSYQSLESENIYLKKTVAQFQKDFSRMEAHCVNLELK